MDKNVYAIFIILNLFLLNGCRFYYKEKEQNQFPLPSDISSISYSMVYEKVFAPRCVSCHGNSGGVNLESYISIKNNIDAIERTTLVTMTMPKEGRLTPSETALLSAWIKNGAPEFPDIYPEPEPKPEEPLIPTFSSIKAKIFEIRCMSCHSVEGSAADIPLDTLRGILDSPREIVLPGNYEESGLYIAITREDEKRMPPPEASEPLSLEEIEVIREWIEMGAPE